MGSNTFFAMLSHRVQITGHEDLFKAMSIAQFPPVHEAPADVIRNGFMCPAAQVIWLQEQAEEAPRSGGNRYFVRLHPRVRYSESTLQLDGTRIETNWKAAKWVSYGPDLPA